jgi:hypothetical protein
MGTQVISDEDVAVFQTLEQFVLCTGVRPTSEQVTALPSSPAPTE